MREELYVKRFLLKVMVYLFQEPKTEISFLNHEILF